MGPASDPSRDNLAVDDPKLYVFDYNLFSQIDRLQAPVATQKMLGINNFRNVDNWL